MKDPIVSFVMSGGVGSRLWPLSREDNPKQFHDFVGDGSMLAKTIRRLKARDWAPTPVHLIASERHAERLHDELEGFGMSGSAAIFEPVGRNTAAAVAIATLQTLAEHGDALVLVVPSDHEISTEKQFWETVEKGIPAAEDGRVVVFGIRPDHPETGYGYIEAKGDGGVLDVSRFVEKPDLETAESYVADGSYYWNAGIFLFKASAMREAFKAARPGGLGRGGSGPQGGDDRQFRALHAARPLQRHPVELGRLRHHREARRHRHGAGRLRLERPRLLAVAARRQPGRRERQRHRRRRRRHRLREFLFPLRRRLAVGDRPEERGGRRDAGCDLRRAGRSQPARQADRAAARKERPAGDQGDAIARPDPGAGRVAAAGAPLAVSRDAAAMVDSGRRRGAWRLPRGAGDGPHAADEAEAHAHHGTPGLCLRGGQAARLGRSGRPARGARARLHGEERPHRKRRLGAHAERRRRHSRCDRGRLRPFLRAPGAGACASLRQSRCVAARPGDAVLPRRPSQGRPGGRLLRDAGARGSAPLQPAHAHAGGVPRLAHGDGRHGLSATGRGDRRAVSGPLLRSRQLDARRVFRRRLAGCCPARTATGPNPAIISSGPRCSSNSSRRAGSRRCCPMPASSMPRRSPTG